MTCTSWQLVGWIVATALVGCSKPNPAWTASQTAADPTTEETLTQGTTDVTTMTASSSTTDPTATGEITVTTTNTSSTSSTTETGTSGTSSTSSSSSSSSMSSMSSSTGDFVCSVNDAQSLNIVLTMSDPAPGEFVVPEFGMCEAGTWSFIGGLSKIVGGKIKAVGDMGACAGGSPEAWIILDPGDQGEENIPIGDSCGKVFVHYREFEGSCVIAGFSVYEREGNSKNPLYAVGSGALAFEGLEEFSGFNFSPTTSVPLCSGDPQICAVAEGTETVAWDQFDMPVMLSEEQDPTPCGPELGYTCSVLRAHRHGDDDQMCQRHLDWVVRKIE